MLQQQSEKKLKYIYNIQQTAQHNIYKEAIKKQQLKTIQKVINFYYKINKFTFNQQLPISIEK
jgi:hypothetical protein